MKGVTILAGIINATHQEKARGLLPHCVGREDYGYCLGDSLEDLLVLCCPGVMVDEHNHGLRTIANRESDTSGMRGWIISPSSQIA